MKTVSSLLEVTCKGARGACRHGYSVSLCHYVYRLRVIVPFERGGIDICSPRKPCGPNMLDKLLKGFIVIPADLPRKRVKRLATLGERVNHDSWVKMCNLCRVLKTSILAELTVRSGPGDIYTKMMSLLCYFVNLIIVYAMS